MVAVLAQLRGALLGARPRRDGRRDAALGRCRPRRRRRRPARLRAAAAVGRLAQRASACRRQRCGITSGTNRRLRVFAVTQIAASFVLVAGAGMLITTLFALQRQQTGFTRQRARRQRAGRLLQAEAGGGGHVLQGSDASHRRAARRRAGRARHRRAVARSRLLRGAVHRRGLRARPTARRIRARDSGRCHQDSSRRSASG